MDNDEYNSWLKSLTTGDQVRIVTYMGCFQSASKVKNVTKTGKIRLETGELFNQIGEYNTTNGFKRIFPIDSKCV